MRYISLISLSKGRLLTMLGVASLGVLFGAVVTGVYDFRSDSPGTETVLNSSAEQLPGPTSIEDLASRGDAIVIASVSSVGETRREGAFDPSTGAFSIVPTESSGPTPGFEVTYYTLKVEEVLVDDGSIGETLSFRVPGTPKSEFQPLGGHRYLLVLGRNADNFSYGSYGFWGELDLSGGVVKDIRGLEIGYSTVDQPADFLNEVRSKLPSPIRTGPSDWMTAWGESLQR